MGNSLGEVKKRLSSTKSTAQITKAMYMVSSSKIKRAEKTYSGYKDFMLQIKNVVNDVLKNAPEDYEHQLMAHKEIKKTAYLIEKGYPNDKLCEVMTKAQSERSNGKQILVTRMNKNKKFQKEKLTAEGYTEFVEF